MDEKEVILDLKYYAEGVIPAEDYTREPGFNLKEEVHPGDEVSATLADRVPRSKYPATELWLRKRRAGLILMQAPFWKARI